MTTVILNLMVVDDDYDDINLMMISMIVALGMCTTGHRSVLGGWVGVSSILVCSALYAHYSRDHSAPTQFQIFIFSLSSSQIPASHLLTSDIWVPSVLYPNSDESRYSVDDTIWVFDYENTLNLDYIGAT